MGYVLEVEISGGSMSDYDFSDLPEEKNEQLDEIRPNFRVTKCCGNCKYFWYYKGNQRRGNCKLPNPHEKKINKSKKEAYYKKETKDLWDKVHITTVCDYHQFRGFRNSIKLVAEYCEVKFLPDGTQDPDSK